MHPKRLDVRHPFRDPARAELGLRRRHRRRSGQGTFPLPGNDRNQLPPQHTRAPSAPFPAPSGLVSGGQSCSRAGKHSASR